MPSATQSVSINRPVAFRAIAGPVRPTGEYRFDAAGDTTTVTFTLEATLTGWKAIVMGRAVQASIEGEMRTLDTLKRILES